MARFLIILAFLFTSLSHAAVVNECPSGEVKNHAGVCEQYCSFKKNINSEVSLSWSKLVYGDDVKSACYARGYVACKLKATGAVQIEVSSHLNIRDFTWTGETCPFGESGEFYGGNVDGCVIEPGSTSCWDENPLPTPDPKPPTTIDCTGDNCNSLLSSHVWQAVNDYDDYADKTLNMMAAELGRRGQLNTKLSNLQALINNVGVKTSNAISDVTNLTGQMVSDTNETMITKMNAIASDVKSSTTAVSQSLADLSTKTDVNRQTVTLMQALQKGGDDAQLKSIDSKLRSVKDSLNDISNYERTEQKGLLKFIRKNTDGIKKNVNKVNNNLNNTNKKLDAINESNNDIANKTQQLIDELSVAGGHIPKSNIVIDDNTFITDTMRSKVKADIEQLELDYSNKIKEFKSEFDFKAELKNGGFKEHKLDLFVNGETHSFSSAVFVGLVDNANYIAAIIMFIAAMAGIKVIMKG
ncbi:hypothetical protein [Vibrio tapetis]|uniref:Uncharacterized protein n=1 Tax=Vibrio tapetis subsp. tapetis TaxID=1671868 RepID=A0A2N8Z9M9_9VIBR|nr:hypothetical protein [Vibrio tapetis]SON48619.1 exported protein of unknown function [Vibrio tapetis subsp. tapetis]